MSRQQRLSPSIGSWLAANRPDAPVYFFDRPALEESARRFVRGFPGLVTYAVKACDRPEVIETLAQAGIGGFDVASPAEIARVRALLPGAVLHYNNPVRSPAEIARAAEAGVASWAIDGMSELEKLAAQVPPGAEVAVRLHLPVEGAAYDFGEKFGEGPEGAAPLLARAAELGYRPAMTFHPGTQCTRPEAWARYIEACADVARRAGVQLERLNVGGGFPADRGEGARLGPIFEAIARARDAAFAAPPALVCEPGRALATEGWQLATRVKAVRERGEVVLNDGIYGAFAEATTALGLARRYVVLTPEGAPRKGRPAARTVFGPTCDSLDRLPGALDLPDTLAEGDYIVFSGMGAYTMATTTGFNGYGAFEVVDPGR